MGITTWIEVIRETLHLFQPQIPLFSYAYYKTIQDILFSYKACSNSLMILNYNTPLVSNHSETGVHSLSLRRATIINVNNHCLHRNTPQNFLMLDQETHNLY